MAQPVRIGCVHLCGGGMTALAVCCPQGAGALCLCSKGNREADKTAMDHKNPRAKRTGTKSTKGKKPALRVVAEQPGEVVPLIRGQGRTPDGITAKQEAFAAQVASGATLAASYRAAYDAGSMSAAAIHNEASRLMDHPGIAQRVNALLRQRQAVEQHDAARIRRHVIERLHQESIDPDSSPAARVRALELLGKLDVVSAFTAKTQPDDAAPAQADLAAMLEARLKALLAKAG